MRFFGFNFITINSRNQENYRIESTRPLAKRERPKLTQDSAVGVVASVEEEEQWIREPWVLLSNSKPVQKGRCNGFLLRFHDFDVSVANEFVGEE